VSASLSRPWALAPAVSAASRPGVPSMMPYVRDRLTRLGVLASRPTAFFIVVTYGALWFFFARDTFDWHAIATLATWMMTVFIQRAEHRDTQALHAKLDHVLDRVDATDGKMAGIDRMQPEDIEQFRKTHNPR
jgi:low affinity Fe/Cu permease